MPLLRFDLIQGRTEAELKALLDAAHEVVVETFKAPVRDRYQIVHEHPASRIIMEDTGLNIPRTSKAVLLQVTSRSRPREMKVAFYRVLCDRLSERCGIPSSDVMVNFVANGDEDWSFGLGRAQFLTGELKSD
jgi:phenylpyruvate tautomerase PptA (4-oxalocrotonate tautomerase family)